MPGSVARPLGLLATLLGRCDEAAGHFELALAVNARLRSRPLLVHTGHDYARLLLRRDGGHDVERARNLLRWARAARARARRPGRRGRRAALDGRLGLIDGAAKAAYRRRLTELRAEGEDADRCNDPGRRARVLAEMEAIAEQLAAAVGLGGRDRQPVCDTERARVTVTKRIRAAVRRIARSHPALAHHLTTCVRTGVFCVCAPPPDPQGDWRT